MYLNDKLLLLLLRYGVRLTVTLDVFKFPICHPTSLSNLD